MGMEQFKMEEKPQVKIENWMESRQGFLGESVGHPRFEDGTQIQTSFVDDYKHGEYKEGDVVETQNTIYTLGKKYSNERS